MIVQGRRVGWWAAEARPYTHTPEPSARHPNPPQFTSNFHPYTIFGTPARVTWNGTYLQLCHNQPGQRGHPIPTTYFHRQLALDHARTNTPLPAGNFMVHHRKYDTALNSSRLGRSRRGGCSRRFEPTAKVTGCISG